ncbi:MAG: TonB-dependent receptor domain-containing protein [Polymorphobacter sp.]|uniref:TonB-dependent receptor domain-containing protein n=1 Tax=Polymorphobacter sp. TaxID=1909290 RepID=UPI003A89434D
MRLSNRTAFHTAVSALALLAMPASVFAQDATQTAAAEAAAEEDDAIIVTGSRLSRDPNATAPLPVSTLTSDDFRNAGNTDVTATLRQIPALISSGTVADSLERGDGGVGQATLDLRQLGANRTLVVVDGWRHVSGVAGSQAVDVATIPNALIERVEVLTGGASAVYGADAVTGVVNYVLKKDFEGIAIDAQTGISSNFDGQSYRLEGTIGKNFADGRGNVTLSLGYTNDAEVLLGDRDFTANNGRFNNSTTYPNPARRFQRGDISASATPNFFDRFQVGGGRFPIGFAIPSAADFADFFPGQTPTAAEQALIDRAANAPRFALGAQPVFAISSEQGLVFRRDFDFFGADINGNGIGDCEESYIGLTGFGGGGCYVTTPGGGVRIFQDGIVASSSNQFGGDGAIERTNATSLTPASERFYANFRASFEAAPEARFWVDAKYARNKATSRASYNTFYDGLLIFPENPFIPDILQADANDGGGLRISRDFTDLGPGITTGDRDTYRIIGGVDGTLTDHLRYELVANYGRTDNKVTFSNSVRYDRLFAAIDVISDPVTGQPICRSDIDDTPHPGSQFFPVIAPGFFTFTPGDGSCVPVNLFNGRNSVSPEGVDFITTPTTDRFRLEQTVLTAILAGDTGGFFNLPGGAVSFVAGFEYRKENSSSNFSDLELGLLPAGSPAGPAGTFIGDISDNQQLIFDPSTRQQNAGGSFDVKELFGEANLPLLKDMPFAYELSLGGAARYSDYSTVGSTFTWNVNGTWAPIEDIRFRGTYARAIRAPNISELFDPAQGATFRPADPCDLNNINATANRQANCLAAVTAAGFPNAADFLANYVDPLNGRVPGTSGGNPDLSEETATSWTVGAVIQPTFIRGLTLSADYYSIKITNAIDAVEAQDTVNTCYDNATFPNQFCDAFDRFGPGTAFPFGFSFIRESQINFGRIETSGIDFQLNYQFSLGKNDFGLSVAGNWTEKLDRFFDPVDTTLVNPGLREQAVPEWSGFGSVNWRRGIFSLNYGLQYVQSTAAASVIEIERIDEEFGPAGFAPDYWIHNLSFNVDATDTVSFYGGVNNLTNAVPYVASRAYPVSGIGRFMFLGVRGRF